MNMESHSFFESKSCSAVLCRCQKVAVSQVVRQLKHVENLRGGKPVDRNDDFQVSRETIPVNFPTILFPHLLNCLCFYMSFLKLMMLDFCEEILLDAIAHVGPESMPRPRPCFAEPGHTSIITSEFDKTVYTQYILGCPPPSKSDHQNHHNHHLFCRR